MDPKSDYSFHGYDDLGDKEEDALLTVKTVYNSTLKAMNNIYIVHGPLTDSKKIIPAGQNTVKREIRIPGYKNISVKGGNTNSYIFNGLVNTRIIFNSRVNHVLLRKCENSVLILDQGTISGIDALYCKKITIQAPHNYTNIEFSSGTSLDGPVDPNTMIRVTHSIDVKINNKSLSVNPFERYQFNVFRAGDVFGVPSSTSSSASSPSTSTPSVPSSISPPLSTPINISSNKPEENQQMSRSLPTRPGIDDDIIVGSPINNGVESIHGSLGQRMFTSNVPHYMPAARRASRPMYSVREHVSDNEFDVSDWDDDD